MIDAEQFKRLWNDEKEPLIPFNKDVVSQLSIADEVKSFMINAGLPGGPAPFLSFHPQDRAYTLRCLPDIFDLPNTFKDFRYLGTQGNGDPLCISESEAGKIVAFNHDKRFTRYSVNTSIFQLAECLL